MNTNLSIGILGVGAIGTVMSYCLQRSGKHELSYFSRSRKNALNLIVDRSKVSIPIKVHTSAPSTKTALDWLIICLKEHHYRDAQHWFSQLITAKTNVVVIRNGLQLKSPLLPFTTEHQILECLIDCPTQLEGTNHYRSLSLPRLTVPKHQLSTSFELLFTDPTLMVDQVEDFKTQSWKKLCESATLGGLLCLYNDTCRIFEKDEPKVHYKNLMNESIKVAIADGAIIEEEFTEKMLTKLLGYPAIKGSSMLTDMRNGQPIELGAKNGIISQLGKQYGIDTPLNDHIISQLYM